ncbi:protein WVD2-like 7 isoform X2 [Prosopis cineraria]|uniref:protein WVD2-like 7 isoform X2 n=1 Tax=Prosopis cineraria TaxID=364024 RepID=UPI002410AF08|nr:protein WVD2-like 7 isoform X2 [Prosopis cineraria]
MGDTACLMQPFCYASGISNETNQSNPIHSLGQSISFGRFMSESLSWEKWSSFSHNRYVEEAERYSRPGSVAQKKAFFEAHYKKLAAQRAAALLDQQANSAASNNDNSQTTTPNVKLVVDEKTGFKILNSQPDTLGSNRDPSVSETENQPSVGKSEKVELQSQLQNVACKRGVREKLSETPPVTAPELLKSSESNKENLASMRQKKPPVSSSKLLKASEPFKFTSSPVKSEVSVCSKEDNFAIPSSKKPALGSPEKKRSPTKSLHVSNFTPIRELNRLTASVMKKFENARVGAASSKVSKDSNLTPLRTPIMASKNEGQKHSSMTPLTENKRTKTPLDLSASGSKRSGTKWHLLSAEKNMRSPVISSPFSLRTEERASRRKKKLEEKFNASESQKVQLHTKLKEKANIEIRKLRQSFCFRARPLPDFYQEIKEPKEEKKGILTHIVESPNQGRKAIQTTLAKHNAVNGGTPTHPQASNSTTKMRTHRQIFQHAKQNDR